MRADDWQRARTRHAKEAGTRTARKRHVHPAGGGHKLGLVGREDVDRRGKGAVGQLAAGDNGLRGGREECGEQKETEPRRMQRRGKNEEENGEKDPEKWSRRIRIYRREKQ